MLPGSEQDNIHLWEFDYFVVVLNLCAQGRVTLENLPEVSGHLFAEQRQQYRGTFSVYTKTPTECSMIESDTWISK